MSKERLTTTLSTISKDVNTRVKDELKEEVLSELHEFKREFLEEIMQQQRAWIEEAQKTLQQEIYKWVADTIMPSKTSTLNQPSTSTNTIPKLFGVSMFQQVYRVGKVLGKVLRR